MNIQEYIYNNLPYSMQSRVFKAYCKSLYDKRYGERFEKSLNKLTSLEKLSNSDLIEYQNEKLKHLIQHSYNTVEYYNELMKSLKLKPKDIETVEDLPKLPLLTRDIVKKDNKKLISNRFTRKQLIHGHTSGTTGSPLGFYWDNDMWFWNNVFDWRQKTWAGMKLGDPICILLGRTIVSPDKVKAPFWQYNPYENQLWISSFHLSDRYFPEILDKINEFKPKFFEGYPSTLSVIAELAKKEEAILNAEATFTSSETLLDTQKGIINKIFNCENYDFYGLAERVIWATECEIHQGKHLNMEYGITEVVNDLDETVDQGQLGYLVGTSLLNYGMPFIRYKTTDLTSISNRKCECGRNSPIMDSVTTKAEDLIRTPSGKFISSSILTHPFKPLKYVEKSQIIQKNIEDITIKIVKREGYTEADTRKLLKSFEKRVGTDVKVNVIFVSDIEREKSGKFKWVKSYIN